MRVVFVYRLFSDTKKEATTYEMTSVSEGERPSITFVNPIITNPKDNVKQTVLSVTAFL